MMKLRSSIQRVSFRQCRKKKKKKLLEEAGLNSFYHKMDSMRKSS